MKIDQTDIPGVLVLTPNRFSDARGDFCETWNQRTLADAGLDFNFVQDNQSLSHKRGTVRGLHFQLPPHAQAKLVRCAVGAVWDVVVDARRGSPTFGKWTGVELSAENGRQILVPEGFLHGFATLTHDALVCYKCSAFYAPEADRSVRFDSAGLGIDWRLDGGPALVSDKDAAAPDWSDFETPFEMAAT